MNPSIHIADDAIPLPRVYVSYLKKMEVSAASHFPRAVEAWKSGLCGKAFDKSEFTTSQLASYSFQRPRALDLIKEFREAESGRSSSGSADGVLDRVMEEGAKALDQLKVDDVIAAGIQGYNLAHLIILNVVQSVSLRELKRRNVVLAKVLLCSRSANNLQLLPIELAALLPDQQCSCTSPGEEGAAQSPPVDSESSKLRQKGSAPDLEAEDGAVAARSPQTGGAERASRADRREQRDQRGSREQAQHSPTRVSFKTLLHVYIDLRLTAILDLPRIAQLAVESGNVSALRCLAEDRLVPMQLPSFERVVRERSLNIYSVINPISYAYLWDHFSLIGREDVMLQPDADGIRPIHAAALLGNYASVSCIRQLSPGQMFDLVPPRAFELEDGCDTGLSAEARIPTAETASGAGAAGNTVHSTDSPGSTNAAGTPTSREGVDTEVAASAASSSPQVSLESRMTFSHEQVGLTPLSCAILSRNVVTLSVVLSIYRKALPTAQLSALFEIRDGLGFTPLHYAVLVDSPDVLNLVIHWAPSHAFSLKTTGRATELASRLFRSSPGESRAGYTPLQLLMVMDSGFAFCAGKMVRRMPAREVRRQLAGLRCGCSHYECDGEEQLTASGTLSGAAGKGSTSSPIKEAGSSSSDPTLANLGHVFSKEPCPVPFNVSTALWCNSPLQRARQNSPAWVLYLMVLAWALVTVLLAGAFSEEERPHDPWRCTVQYSLVCAAILLLVGLTTLPLFNKKAAPIDLDAEDALAAGTVCAYCLTLARKGDVEYSASGEAAHCDCCGACIRERLFHSRALRGCITSRTAVPAAVLSFGLLLVLAAGLMVGFTSDFRLTQRFLAHFAVSVAAFFSVENLLWEDLLSARDRAKLISDLLG